MRINERKTISINMDVDDLALFDYACNLMSVDLGFRVSRTHLIVRLLNGYLDGVDIDDLDRKQYRLPFDKKRPSNEAKRVVRPEPDGHKSARESTRSVEVAASTNSGKK